MKLNCLNLSPNELLVTVLEGGPVIIGTPARCLRKLYCVGLDEQDSFSSASMLKAAAVPTT
jgi:hypothetical protein